MKIPSNLELILNIPEELPVFAKPRHGIKSAKARGGVNLITLLFFFFFTAR